MRIFFISDLHLDETTTKLNQALKNFLFRLQPLDQLFILGDFFETWLGDDSNAPWISEIQIQLQQVHDRKCPIFFMHGNRDFLVGKKFCHKIGATLITEPFKLDLFGTPTLLAHGDAFCTKDQAYQQFRQLVRTPSWQQEFLNKTMAERIHMAAAIRAESQASTKQKSMEIMDVTPEEIIHLLQKSAVQRLIHGHTHRPNKHKFVLAGRLPAERWVLGDWYLNEKANAVISYLCASETGLELIAGNKTFTASHADAYNGGPL